MAAMKYCPRCARELTTKHDGGRDRLACPNESCGFIDFGDFSIGVGAVALRGEAALLVQRGWEPGRGAWQIPGGYAEHDEGLVESVEREVLEEAGITARVRDAIGFRHSIGGSIGGPSTNIYIVFRLDSEPGEPSFDNDQATGAGFFSLDAMANMERAQGLSRWAIQLALDTPEGSGMRVDVHTPAVSTRPGWVLFGLQPPLDLP